jgi:hypothetical protein
MVVVIQKWRSTEAQYDKFIGHAIVQKEIIKGWNQFSFGKVARATEDDNNCWIQFFTVVH